jgi:hypothetical protein
MLVVERETCVKKLFHFDAPRGEYQADAAVVWCFDHRFNLAVRKFLKRAGIAELDSIQIAGGTKSLASPARESDREFVLDQIRTSIRLHRTKKVMLMLHTDCGGYGGLAKFGGDAQAEIEHYQSEFEKAVSVLRTAVPNVQVETYYVNFDGVCTLDEIPHTASIR